MSSSGDIKMSLRLMTWRYSVRNHIDLINYAHIFVSKVFEEFQLAVGPFGQDWGRERLHDLFHRHRLLGELVFGRAYRTISIPICSLQR